MASPAHQAGSLLTALVGGVTGWELKYGMVTPTPDQIVVLTDSGGQNPNPRWNIDYPTFQALVRGKPGGYSTAYDKIRAVRDVLLGLTPQDISGDRWASVICMGDIGFIGFDETERPMLSVNFRAIIHPASTGNREAL